MSADTPESIPTSADARSHRPTKRRALTPSSSHAASVDALFARPDRDIRLPSEANNGRPTHAGSRPPEIVTNVQGSSAGAGSGEFHVYKAARRREYERLREMDAEVKREKDQVDFAAEKESRDKKDEEKTRRNRERREKIKARKAKKGKGGAGDAGGAGNGNGSGGDGGDTAATGARGKGIQAQALPRRDEDETDGANGTSAAQPQGLVIHDDD